MQKLKEIYTELWKTYSPSTARDQNLFVVIQNFEDNVEITDIDKQFAVWRNLYKVVFKLSFGFQYEVLAEFVLYSREALWSLIKIQ